MTSFEDELKVWQAHYRSYLDHLGYRHRLASRVIAAEYIKKFWAWMNARRLLPSSLTPNHFRLYSEELEAGVPCRFTTSYSPVTLAALRRAVLNWTAYLQKKKLLFLDPFQEFCAGSAPKVYRLNVLSVAQVQKILACPDPSTPQGLRSLAILEIAYGSGLRAREIASLSLSSLDLARGCLHLRHTKNGWDRSVPLTQSAVLALRRYLQEARPQLLGSQQGPALWVSCYGNPLTISSLKILARPYLPSLDFHFTLHDLRRACATHLLQGGASIGQIGLLLGHQCLQSTTIYAMVELLDLQRVHQASHPRA